LVQGLQGLIVKTGMQLSMKYSNSKLFSTYGDTHMYLGETKSRSQELEVKLFLNDKTYQPLEFEKQFNASHPLNYLPSLIHKNVEIEDSMQLIHKGYLMAYGLTKPMKTLVLITDEKGASYGNINKNFKKGPKRGH
jgi:hypothetical protein